MDTRITQIIKENQNNAEKVREEIKKITKQNFTLYESNGEIFVEFDDPVDMIDNGYKLLEG